jgi:tetratricopeptide (TPR) repeat protein
MNRQQLVIIVAAIAFVVVLFSLPKVLLNKEEKELENSAEFDKKEQKPSTKSTSKHSDVSFSETEIKKSSSLKLALSTEADLNKKIALLDSISVLYNAKTLYDSSAYFSERALSTYSTIESWSAIGDACYKAYYFAADDEKAAEWGSKTQEYYKKALEKKPDLLDMKARMAMTYTRSANPMQAALTLREVLEKDPNNEQALLNMGLLSIQSGQHDKAITRFSKLLSLNPENWLATFYLGISYAEKGKKVEAKECFEKVIKNEKQAQIVEAANEYLKQLSVNP